MTHRDAGPRAGRPRRLPAHADLRPAAGDVRARSGHRAVGRRREPLPRLPVRPRRHLARPRPPGGGRRRSTSRPRRCCTCRTCSPRRRRPRWPSPSTGWCRVRRAGGQPRLRGRCSSATAAPRPTSAPSSWPAVGRPRHATPSCRPTGRFHGRTLATLHATGQPAKHEAFQPLPEGFRHVAWDDLDALGGGHRPDGRRGAARARAGGGRREPGHRRVLPGRAASCATSGACCSWSTRCRPASAAPGRGSRYQHFGVEPDVVTMAKALGNGVPIGACWAKREVAAAFQPGDHATTFGGTPIATAAAKAVLAEIERIDAPAAAQRAGARLMDALRRDAGCVRRARPRPADRGRARRGDRRQDRGGGVPRGRARGQRRHAHRAAVRAAAQRDRRRDRRGRRPPGQGAGWAGAGSSVRQAGSSPGEGAR